MARKAASSRKKSVASPAATPSSPRPKARAGKDAFPIVGIGASAGGLEAIEQFLGHVPLGCGMAFVVVQHLDPTHKGIMPELLQRTTAMKVSQAGNRMRVRPDCVYVIPPNKDLSILRGVLQLLDPVTPRGPRLPIDFFFRALAEDSQERSIGVILSGMGSDGTLGLRAIKEKAGLVLVQEPASAKFDGMPKSAIDDGLADIVAPAAELPGRIVEFLQHAPPHGRGESEVELKSSAHRSGLDKVVLLLRARNGHDFSLYKKSTVYRRIERRMGIHKIDRIADYVSYLRENPQELDLLFKELLIGVTSFFRDPAAWKVLQESALPALLKDCPNGRVLRAWVPGCSTGEEPYSLAIAFRETVERIRPQARISLQIFASDLDADAVEQARAGLYPANIASDVLPERLSRFFVEEGSSYRIGNEIREMVVFAPQNLIMDPPFTKLDILSCRNLLIYLGPELQKRLVPLFHYSLNPGGILFLGSAETIGGFTDLFVPLEVKSRLYRRVDSTPRTLQVEFPSRHFPVRPSQPEEARALPEELQLQKLADQLLLHKFSPAAVLVNSLGDILYINGRTGKYLEPAAGKANWNIHAMARDGLNHEIALALPKALREGTAVVRQSIRAGGSDATQQVVVTVYPILEPVALRGMAMVCFTDTVPLPKPTSAGRHDMSRKRATELEAALRQAREELQTLREEMQTSQEELKSANEELQSTNEELQSTNEELTTSKEEMQSLNEELQTVNLELQSKLDDLSSANSDMKNLLNSTDIATIFLDGALHVRRFTNQAQNIFKLIPGDAGRPLSDIVTDLRYPELQDDATEVLRTLVFCEKQIETRDGRWYHVKIMPYRTLDNVIDGVVITFTDITLAKQLEAELRGSRSGTPDPAGGKRGRP